MMKTSDFLPKMDKMSIEMFIEEIQTLFLDECEFEYRDKSKISFDELYVTNTIHKIFVLYSSRKNSVERDLGRKFSIRWLEFIKLF